MSAIQLTSLFCFSCFQNVIFADHLSLISPPLFENMCVHCPIPIPSHYLEISLKKSYRHTTSNFLQLLFGYETYSASGNSSVNRLNYHLHVKPYPVCRKSITRKTKTKHNPTHSISMVCIFTHHWPYRNQPSVGQYITRRIDGWKKSHPDRIWIGCGGNPSVT